MLLYVSACFTPETTQRISVTSVVRGRTNLTLIRIQDCGALIGYFIKSPCGIVMFICVSLCAS
jgi:hypothetical protein